MSIRTQGSRIEIGDGASPEVFTEIESVTDFNGFTGGRPLIDVTTLASTGREFVTGIPDYGNLDFNIIYDGDETTHTDLYALFQNGESNTFRLVFPDSPEEIYTFTGFVLNFQFSGPLDEVVRAAVTIKVTGTPTDNN